MKKVEAIIRPFKLEDVKSALTEVGIEGMTLTEVKGFGRQRGQLEIFRGSEFNMEFLSKIKVEAVVADDVVESACCAIIRAAKCGTIGDGKIFVSDVEHAVRIRTGEIGHRAVSG